MYGGFVLAGGRSRRMGSDKALLRLPGGTGAEAGGCTLLERQVALVIEAVGRAAVVGPRLRYGHIGISIIEDEVAEQGPLGGIQAALRTSPFVRNLFVPVDLPALTAAFLLQLLAHEDASCVVAKGQPLCGVYASCCLPAIDAAIRAGKLRVTELVRTLGAREVEPPDPAMLANVNTWDDWTRMQGSSR